MTKNVKIILIVSIILGIGFFLFFFNQNPSLNNDEEKIEEPTNQELKVDDEEIEEPINQESKVDDEEIEEPLNKNELLEPEESKKTIHDFIQCLKEKGVIIYGSEWCPFCKDLAESLGGYEVVDPIYVECTVEKERCSQEMIGRGVPEIQIKGELYQGSRDPEEIAKETSCELYYE